MNLPATFRGYVKYTNLGWILAWAVVSSNSLPVSWSFMDVLAILGTTHSSFK